MGFFFVSNKPQDKNLKGLSPDFLRRHGCNVCPLNELKDVQSPKMLPTGSKKPSVLMVGEAPSVADDSSGKHFSGKAGNLLKSRIPEEYKADVRFTHIVNCRTSEPDNVSQQCCFVPDTKIQPVGGIKKLFRREYSGMLISLRTRKGHVLTGTPNHPVYSTNGLVPLQSIKVGDNVFSTKLVDIEPVLSVPPDKDRKPTEISQVFSSFASFFRIERKIVTSVDFHGDGVPESYVDIIRTDSELRCEVEARSDRQQQLLSFHFSKTYSRFRNLVNFCSFYTNLVVKAMVASFSTFIERMSAVPRRSSAFAVSDFNFEVLFKKSRNLSGADIEKRGNFIYALSTCVKSCYFLFGKNKSPSMRMPKFQDFSPSSERDSFADKKLFNCGNIGASQLADIVQSFPISVELDEVVFVEIRTNFKGHVYNLETESHSYIAEGLLVSNCSIRFEEEVATSKPKAIFGFGNVPLFNLVKQSGVSIWRGRKIPVNVGGHACWYYPMQAPIDLIQKRKFEPRDKDSYGSEDEFAFALDLKRAFAELDDLLEPIVHTVEDASADIELVYDINRIAELLDVAANDPSAGVDIETNCLRPYTSGAKILTFGVASKSAGTFAFPVGHSQSRWTKLERKQLDVLIKRFLYDSKCKKIVHHLPFELEWFAFFYGAGCFYASKWEDSESAGYVLDPRRGGLSLDFLCLQYFGFNLKAISGLDRTNLDKSPLSQVLQYNAIDARYHRLLWLEEWKRIKREKLQSVYRHQMRRIPSLVLAQLQGVPVDQAVVARLKKKYSERASNAALAISKDESVIEFEKQKGRKFNPSSPPDVNYLLKTVLGLDIATTAKGELAHIEHPVANLIVKWREPNKVLSTYIEAVDDVSEGTNLFPDGMLHPIISTTRTVTSRTSSDSPNIQNFPKRDEELKEVRSQVKSPDRNMVIVSFDYAGIQARNVAMESKDKALIEAFWNNYDIHTDWMQRINKKFPKWIPKDKLGDKAALKGFRHLAKNKFVFPTFFGAQAFNTSEGLGIPKNLCEDLREEFFDEFKGIKKWHTGLDKFYSENGYVTGLSGYRRHAPVSMNEKINSPIQADEAIIVMDAMIRLSEMEDPRYQPILEVHDDLTFCWPKNEVDARAEIVLSTMVNCPFEWAKIVPLEVEMSYGPDWIDQKPMGSYLSNGFGGFKNAKET